MGVTQRRWATCPWSYQALVPERVTAHTEGLCAVIWHLLVSHPLLQRAPMKWKSTAEGIA